MEYLEIEQMLYEFLGTKGKGHIRIQLDETIEGQMEAKVNEDLIKVNFCMVNEYSKRYQLSLSDYFIIALCHELGHMDDLDFKRDKQMEKLNVLLEEADAKKRLSIFTEFVNDNIKKEFTAHKNGSKYVHDTLKTDYDLMNRENKIQIISACIDLATKYKLKDEVPNVINGLEKEISEFILSLWRIP